MSGILRAVSISILTGSSLSPLILNIPPFFAPPLRTDQDKHHVVFGHHLLDLLPKINSKGDTVDIHENSIGTIVLSQTIANAASNGGGIRTPIRNYYVGHGSGHLRLSLTVTPASSKTLYRLALAYSFLPPRAIYMAPHNHSGEAARAKVITDSPVEPALRVIRAP